MSIVLVATAMDAAGDGGPPRTPAPVRLDLVSPDGCGSSDELGRRVAARSSRLHPSRKAGGEHRVRVEIARAGPHSFTTTLTFGQEGGRTSARTIQTTSCDEALDAAALIVAVTLDSSRAPDEPQRSWPRGHNALPRPPPLEPGTPSGGAPRAAGKAASTPADSLPSATADSRVPPPPPPPPPARAPALAPPAPSTPLTPPQVAVSLSPPSSPAPMGAAPVTDAPPAIATTFTGSAGLTGQATTAPAARAMPGIGAYLLLGWDRPSGWSPRARIAATHFWASSFTTSGGVARFNLDLLAVDLCPVWSRLRSFAGGGCVGGSAGRLAAEGADTFSPQWRGRPFVTGAVSALATYQARGAIELSIYVNGGAPLIRDRFQFRPVVFYQVPAFTLTAGVGVGLRFR